MQFFIYYILFQCLIMKISSTNYIRCTSKCPQINVSFLAPLKLPFHCQANTNLNNGNIYEYGLICVIDYRVDYDAKYVYLKFKASNYSKSFQQPNQSEFLLQSIWLGLNKESYQPNITHRTYGCNTNDDCARDFYFNTIEYLITNGQIQLEEIKSKLYRENIPPNKLKYRRCRLNDSLNNTYFNLL